MCGVTSSPVSHDCQRVGALVRLVVSCSVGLWVLACGSGAPRPTPVVDAGELTERACQRSAASPLNLVVEGWVGFSRTPGTPSFALEQGLYLFAIGIGPRIPSPSSGVTASRVSASMTLVRETDGFRQMILNDELRPTRRGFVACRRVEVEPGQYKIEVAVPASWGVAIYRP